MVILTLPTNYNNLTINQNQYLQLDITTQGAFCILTNTATFNPPLPTGLLAVGKYPDPVHYPMGAQATSTGACNYTFSTAKTACDPVLTETVGKVITVGNTRPDEHEHKPHK